MDRFGWFIFAVVAFNVIRTVMKGVKEEGASAPPPPPLKARPRPSRQVGTAPSRAPVPRQKSPEELWQEMLGQLQQTEQARRSGQLSVEEVEGWEETQSLEVAESVRSLEVPVVRAVRKRVDYDDEAENVARRRVVAAASRDGAITPADHQAFDGAIRAPVSTSVLLTKGRDDLRRAMVWREVLGPPVSLREG